MPLKIQEKYGVDTFFLFSLTEFSTVNFPVRSNGEILEFETKKCYHLKYKRTRTNSFLKQSATDTIKYNSAKTADKEV